MFRGGPVKLTAERWADLREVNRSVNQDIVPERNERGLAGEAWLINPNRGDCNDYAVSNATSCSSAAGPRARCC